MAVIVITDLTNVSVDGVASGSVTDLLTNFKNVAGIRNDTLNALKAWDTAKAKAADDARQAQLADLMATKDAKIDNLQAKITDMQSLIDSLGGTLLARQMRRQLERQKALDAKAEAEAALAAIDAEPVA